jgi:glycosyltransferase involved in cell wall biosynthesis
MRLAYLLLNQGRGSGEVARQQIRCLIDRVHQIYLLHPMISQEVEGAIHVNVKLHTDRIPVHEYLPAAGDQQQAVSRMAYEEAVAYLPAYEHALESVIRDVDLIIGNHANLSAIATHAVAKQWQKPYALFLHGTGIEPRHTGGYDDRIWKRIELGILEADGIIVTTEYVRDELVKPLVDVPAARFFVLPCGVDLDEFHPENVVGIRAKYDLPPSYVIAPGALTAVKGPQNVVAASERYADLAPTIFIGAGELREELEKQLVDRGRFLGFVPGEDKAQLINAASILTAAPEKKEDFGIIYIEALGGGTPVVAYSGGGVDSIVLAEVGVLTERNPITLGNAIRDLLLDSEHRNRMALTARARAKTYFGNQMLAERLEAWLQTLLDGRAQTHQERY